VARLKRLAGTGSGFDQLHRHAGLQLESFVLYCGPDEAIFSGRCLIRLCVHRVISMDPVRCYKSNRDPAMTDELHVIFGGGEVGQPLARILGKPGLHVRTASIDTSNTAEISPFFTTTWLSSARRNSEYFKSVDVPSSPAVTFRERKTRRSKV